MKKVFLFTAALAAFALASCNKEMGTQVDGPMKMVDATVQIVGTPETRVTDATYADESKVNDLQVYVFDADGALENYYPAGAATSVTVTVSAGEKTIWAVVNAPATTVNSLTELKEKATLLQSNARDNFIMTGSVTQELVDGGNVPITVKRIVSRVAIKHIETDFKGSRADLELPINAIYLINVAADNNLDVAMSAPADWYNKLGYSTSVCDGLLFDSIEGVTVKNNVLNDAGEIVTDNSYTVEHAFYPYPNPIIEETYADEWCPRHTMLVVEVTYQNARKYYPIELPVLERNKTYTIEKLTLTRLPGDVPYKPIETGDANVVITVNDWEMGYVWTNLVI